MQNLCTGSVWFLCSLFGQFDDRLLRLNRFLRGLTCKLYHLLKKLVRGESIQKKHS